MTDDDEPWAVRLIAIARRRRNRWTVIRGDDLTRLIDQLDIMTAQAYWLQEMLTAQQAECHVHEKTIAQLVPTLLKP